MKKLKQKQLGPWCDYCPPKTVRAVYAVRGFNSLCCEAHYQEAELTERAINNEHVSEADYQTWWNL
jgi:hypothetical protein